MSHSQHRPKRVGHAHLRQLLSERNQYPERATAIDQQIHQAFTRRVALLVLDMCGFSRLTAEHGVIHFLAMVRQMEQAAGPGIAGNGGQLIKQEADNLFAIFDTPEQALEAACDIVRSVDAMNVVLPQERAMYVSVGIGYGDTLIIDDADMFGQEMNSACKLGEDIAGKQEILLTAAAFAALPQQRYACEADSGRIGNNALSFYRFQARN